MERKKEYVFNLSKDEKPAKVNVLTGVTTVLGKKRKYNNTSLIKYHIDDEYFKLFDRHDSFDWSGYTDREYRILMSKIIPSAKIHTNALLGIRRNTTYRDMATYFNEDKSRMCSLVVKLKRDGIIKILPNSAKNAYKSCYLLNPLLAHSGNSVYKNIQELFVGDDVLFNPHSNGKWRRIFKQCDIGWGSLTDSEYRVMMTKIIPSAVSPSNAIPISLTATIKEISSTLNISTYTSFTLFKKMEKNKMVARLQYDYSNEYKEYWILNPFISFQGVYIYRDVYYKWKPTPLLKLSTDEEESLEEYLHTKNTTNDRIH